MAGKDLQVDRRPGGFAVITLAKEPANVMDLAFWEGLSAALAELEADSAMHGVIFTSGLKRDIFTAGRATLRWGLCVVLACRSHRHSGCKRPEGQLFVHQRKPSITLQLSCNLDMTTQTLHGMALLGSAPSPGPLNRPFGCWNRLPGWPASWAVLVG